MESRQITSCLPVKTSTAMNISHDEFRVCEQVDAWAKLAGMWESDAGIDEEIDTLYAARTPGRTVEFPSAEGAI